MFLGWRTHLDRPPIFQALPHSDVRLAWHELSYNRETDPRNCGCDG